MVHAKMQDSMSAPCEVCMRFSSTVVKFLLAFTVSLGFMAHAAPAAEPVKVALQAFKVVDVNGKETLT